MTKSSGRRVLASVVCAASLVAVGLSGELPGLRQSTGEGGSTRETESVRAAHDRLPLAFTANEGQTDAQVRFLARVGGSTLFLTPTGAVLRLGDSQVLRMELVGATPEPEIHGLEPATAETNYYAGTDPANWQTDVATYAKVAYRGVYPGVDLVYYGNQGQVEYDFVVAPGADPARIGLTFEGAKSLQVDPQGDLVVGLPDGEVRQRRPVVYQDEPSGRHAVPGRYVIDGDRVSFSLGAYDRSRPLVIDPLIYSTYLGGTSPESAWAIAVDGAGNAIVSGRTESNDFPVKNEVPGTGYVGLDDLFVTKFNLTGSQLIYSTYLSGTDNDWGRGLKVDSAGNAYLVGTAGPGFPTTANALKQCVPPPETVRADAFVAKFSPSGTLVYSTCVGGSYREFGVAIDIDGAGNAVIVGTTFSYDFPLAGPIQATFGGDEEDAFVAKLNATGTGLLYATYLGGDGVDRALGIALDKSGNSYVAGITRSTNFPVAGTPLRSSKNGPSDVQDLFVTKVNPTGSALDYSTYLGSSGLDGVASVSPVGVAVDRSGQAYVASETQSTDFPTAGTPFQPNHGGGTRDVVVAKLNASGSALIYSSYLGGSGSDGDNAEVGLAVDGVGNAYVVGTTNSPDFPTANAIGGAFGGLADAFLTKVHPSGSSLVYSTYLGGTSWEFGTAVALDADTNPYVAGGTSSFDFPTAGTPYQRLQNANPQDPFRSGDAFVTKFDSLVGFLRVTTDPPVPSQISVDGVPRDSWGLNWVKIASGPHTVCFDRDIENFLTPPCQNVIVNPGATTTVTGTYTKKAFLQVGTAPSGLTDAVISVDGVPRDNLTLYTDLPVGSHQVCWGPVANLAPPPCQTVNLNPPGTTVTVIGNYTSSPGSPGPSPGDGLLRVTTSPAVPSQISVDGIPRDTWATDWLRIAPGSHTVCFRNNIEGYTAPPCQTVSVSAGVTTAVQGTFVPRGFLKVEVAPAGAPATVYVDGSPRNDLAAWTDLPAGPYEVCFGMVAGYFRPACRTVNLTGGVTTVTVGTYTASP